MHTYNLNNAESKTHIYELINHQVIIKLIIRIL